MSITVLSPRDASAPIQLANGLWRKRVLPVGDINYEGRVLHFTPQYIQGLERAFRDGAYDAVPFQLADARNSHTNDPERTRGQIIDMRAEADGLYITAQLTPAGEAVISQNPYLGVSARIVENYARSDGKYYEAAIQHVLGTLDPRVTGLGAWEPIEMSNSGGQIIIDLSAARFQGDPEPTPEEWDILLDVLNELDAEEAGMYGGSEGLADLLDGLSDEQLDALAAEGYAGQDATSGLANRYAAIELAYATEGQRRAEDAAPALRRKAGVSPAEDRLTAALDRIARGTYTPSPAARAMGLASPAGPALELAQPGQLGAITGDVNCGPSDPLTGLCIERYHAHSCGSLADAEITEALQPVMADLALRPALDAGGRAWADQYGAGMTWTDHLEAATGQRLGDMNLFETGASRRELSAAQRTHVFGDVDDDDDPGYLAPLSTRGMARRAAAQAGLTPPDTGRERERYAELRDRAMAQRAWQARGRVHPDYGESTRERRERLHQPAEPVPHGDGPIMGSLPTYTAGQL